ncbi:MAG: class I SAM-dependent methyltransferase [Planctomycetota bacterium]
MTAPPPEFADPGARVPIEVSGEGLVPADQGSYRWKDALRTSDTQSFAPIHDGPVNERFVKEEHHNAYGRPWALGRYEFDFLRSCGVTPDHRVLEFGCGCGRLGVWLIPYLNAKRYFGIDAHARSLEAFATYEVPLHQLAPKQPRLLLNRTFDLDHFGEQFDVIVDCYSSFHCDEADTRTVFAAFARTLRPGGLYIGMPAPKLDDDALHTMGLRRTRHEMQPCPLLEGHSWQSDNEWVVYERMNVG